MSAFRFNHVFAALMVISALSAFVIPEKYTTKVQPQVQGLFQPVAKPTRAIAAWAAGRVEKPDPTETRDVKTLAAENERLRQDYMAAMHANDELRRRIQEYEQLGELRQHCTPVRTVGPDAGGRESLLIKAHEALKQGQFVLSPRGIVGVLERPPGVAGASVRLITDPGVRVEAYFATYTLGGDGHSYRVRLDAGDDPLVPLVQGVGKGAMQCLSLTMEQVQKANVQAGTYVMLEDKEWDERLHGRPLGRVSRVAPQTTAPLYADIRIEPVANLLRLQEVMVLTK
jgi:hypothetical protein